MQQIAKMFASLGFNVDTSGLDAFKGKMREARGDMALLARNARVLQNNFNDVAKAIKNINDNLKIKKSDTKLSKTYDELKLSVEKVDKAFQSITKNQTSTTRSLGKIHSSIIFGENKWKSYADQVQRTKDLLRGANEKMKELRSNASVTARVNINQNTSRGFGSSSPSNVSGGGHTIIPFGGFGRSGGASGSSWLGGIAPLFRSMSPATAIGGGLAASGFAVKETVQAGREQQKMENVLQFSSNSMEEFRSNLEYVRKEAIRLGVTSAELGRAFAQINMSAEGLSQSDKRKMFTDMSEAFVTVGANTEEQKLLFKAVNQMFSLGRIQAEEMNQLTGQGLVPRKMIYDVVKDVYKVKTNQEVQELQKANKLDPSKIIPEVFKRMAEKGRETGATQKALGSSQAAQNRFFETLKQASKQVMDAGLDKALAKLFDVLTILAKALADLATGVGFAVGGLKQLKTVLDEATNGNGLLAIALTVISVLFLRKGKAIVSVIKKAKDMKNIFVAIKAFFDGGLGKALITLGKRFFFIVTALTTLWSVGKAVNAKMNGEVTWIDVWSEKLTTLGMRMELFWLKIKFNFKKYGLALTNPVLFAAKLAYDSMQDYEFDSYFGKGGDRINSKGVLTPQNQPKTFDIKNKYSNIPNTIAIPNTQISRTDSEEMLKKAREALKMTSQVTINVGEKKYQTEVDLLAGHQIIDLRA